MSKPTTSNPSVQTREDQLTLRRYRSLRRLARTRGEIFKIERLPAPPTRCPVLGIPLARTFGIKGGGPTSPTATRLCPELGWVEGNVRVISGRASDLLRHASIAAVSGRLERYDSPQAIAGRRRQECGGKTPATVMELRAIRDWLRDVSEGRA